MTRIRWLAKMHGEYIISQTLQYTDISGNWKDVPTVYDKLIPKRTESEEVQLPLEFELPLPPLPEYPNTTSHVVQQTVPMGVPKLWL